MTLIYGDRYALRAEKRPFPSMPRFVSEPGMDRYGLEVSKLSVEQEKIVCYNKTIMRKDNR